MLYCDLTYIFYMHINFIKNQTTSCNISRIKHEWMSYFYWGLFLAMQWRLFNSIFRHLKSQKGIYSFSCINFLKVCHFFWQIRFICWPLKFESLVFHLIFCSYSFFLNTLKLTLMIIFFCNILINPFLLSLYKRTLWIRIHWLAILLVILKVMMLSSRHPLRNIFTISSWIKISGTLS